MDLDEIVTWVWLAGGVALMLLELVIPGLVVVFMGAAAVLVGGLRWLGLLSDHVASVAAWMVLSVVLVLTLRRVLGRWVPSEVRRDHTDEELEALGKVVEVVADCDMHSADGRIRYQGTTWPARTAAGTAPAGSKVRLLFRENLHWIVEPVSALENRADGADGS